MNTLSDKDTFWTMLRASLLYGAWTVALIATLGSLFFSEVMNFVPCELCWYQRIFMYPIVFILTTGILLRDKRVVSYALPLCIIGLAISIYHNLLYYNVISQGWHVCTAGVPCEARWIQWFGFVGIPFLSLTAFVLVMFSLLWYRSLDLDATDSERTPSIKTGAEWIRWSLSLILFVLYIALFFVAATDGSGIAETVDNSTSSITPESTESSSQSDTQLIERGQRLYSLACAACHGQDRQGMINLGPGLTDNQFVAELTDDELLNFIITGRPPGDPLNTSGIPMPGKGTNPALSEDDIYAIIAFVRLYP